MGVCIKPASAGANSPVLDPKQLRSGVVRHSMVFLLVALALFFAITPFLQNLRSARYIEAALTSLLLIGALFAVAGRRRRLLIGVLLAVPVFVARWASLVWEGDQPNVFYIAAFAVFIFVV